VIADASLMKVEFIRRRYERDSPNFLETLDFMRQLGLVEVKADEAVITADYEAFLDQLNRSVQTEQTVREFMLSRLLRRTTPLSTHVRGFLSSFHLKNDRYQFAPTVSQNLEYSGLRNLLIELDFLSVETDPIGYIVTCDDFLTYGGLKSSRRLSPEEFVALEQRRQQIGKAAELAVVEYEKQRLREFPELVAMIDHVALTDVSAGYDIGSHHGSFDDTGMPVARLIEVKAVSASDYGFYWTRNEIEKAVLHRQDYYLYLLPAMGKNGFDQQGLRLIQDPYSSVYLNVAAWDRKSEVLSFSLISESAQDEQSSDQDQTRSRCPPDPK